MLETLLNRSAAWLANAGPELDVVLATRAGLMRNLADYPFPERSSDEQRRAAEERIVSVVEQAKLPGVGRYYALESLEAGERRLLAERGLLTPDGLADHHACARGVFLGDDEGFAVVVNGQSHIQTHAAVSGLQPGEAWKRLNMADDVLASRLDFAFDEKLGYLTAEIAALGTGLKFGVVLHLPALALVGQVAQAAEDVREQWHTLEGLVGPSIDAPGAFYRLGNVATLGRSEEEIVYHVQHAAEDLAERERAARETLRTQTPHAVEDRVGRALGVAREARLLDLGEALDRLSWLRMGIVLGLVESVDYATVHATLLDAQPGHLELRAGHAGDDMELSRERADLFRDRFADGT
jgi:protein arginine kinase